MWGPQRFLRVKQNFLYARNWTVGKLDIFLRACHANTPHEGLLTSFFLTPRLHTIQGLAAAWAVCLGRSLAGLGCGWSCASVAQPTRASTPPKNKGIVWADFGKLHARGTHRSCGIYILRPSRHRHNTCRKLSWPSNTHVVARQRCIGSMPAHLAGNRRRAESARNSGSKATTFEYESSNRSALLQLLLESHNFPV